MVIFQDELRPIYQICCRIEHEMLDIPLDETGIHKHYDPTDWLNEDMEEVFIKYDDMHAAARQMNAIIQEVCGREADSARLIDAIQRDSHMSRAYMAGLIRKDWPLALQTVTHGCLLAGSIGYWLREEDLSVLAKLHKENKFRKKIEGLLAMCDSRTAYDFIDHHYEEYLKEKD